MGRESLGVIPNISLKAPKTPDVLILDNNCLLNKPTTRGVTIMKPRSKDVRSLQIFFLH